MSMAEGAMQPIAELLTEKMQQLVQSKTNIKQNNELMKPLRAASKQLHDEILQLMCEHGIDKANFEELGLCATVSTSKRKRSLSSATVHEMLSKHIPENEADELVSKIKKDIDQSARSVKFVRFTKK